MFSLTENPHIYNYKDTGLISEEKAQEIRSKMTPSLFACNYELRIIASEDVIFTNPQTGAEPQLVEQGWAHLDAAYYGEDYTAFTLLNIHDRKFYVFGKCWRKHIDDVLDEIVAWCNHFKIHHLYCENNADKGFVAQKLRERGLTVSTYNEHQNKYIKIASHLKSEWSDVIFVKGTDEKYINQICDYNENADHDDCPDSLASLIRITGRRKNETMEDLLYNEFLGKVI